MKLHLEKRTLILISILLFLLILSLSVYFFADNNLVRRVLFFPYGSSISGEIRRLPRQQTLEKDIELLIKEMILGPYKIDHLRIIPEKTRLQNLFLRDKSSLYIDFSADFIVTENEFIMVTSEMIDLISKNLRYNFPILEEITLSVDGQTLQLGIK